METAESSSFIEECSREGSSLQSISSTGESCLLPPLSSFPVKYATRTNFGIKDLERAVDFNPKKIGPCESPWYRDVKSTHIRNKHLLDLPFDKPKCCAHVYNISLDRKKLKKVQRYGLTRPVRTFTFSLETEEVERCIPNKLPEGEKVTIFPECYLPSDSSSDESDDESEFELCKSGSVSECSGCSTIGGGTRSKMHKVIKKDWRDLLHALDREICQEAVAAEMSKHKRGMSFPLRVKPF